MRMRLAKALFWGSLGALFWTHAGYPAAAALAARVRARPVRKGGDTPRVSVIVAAHDEEDVIERRLENLLGLDYPEELVEVFVASDASTDRTDELVEAVAAREPRVGLGCAPRGGKIAAQNLAVSEAESALGSVTGGNGSIYAVRRGDYVEVDPRYGHDLAFPYLMVQRGRRAVYEPEAVAWEKPSRDVEDEYRRKVRMFEHCWLIVLQGRMLRGLDSVYLVEIVSHRLLRYGSGLLHLALLGSSLRLARAGRLYAAALAGQLLFLAAAVGRPGLPRYYA